MLPSHNHLPLFKLPLSLVLLIITLLLPFTLSDCPIQHYPLQTIIGFVNAQLATTQQQKPNTQSTYTYSLKEALSTATPDVVIGVNAMEFKVGYDLGYRVDYQPTPRFGTLSFRVQVESKSSRWGRLQFNFIATNNPQISANSIHFPQLTSPTDPITKTKFTLISKLNLADHMTTKPIIQAFISGISLRSKKSSQQMQAAMKSVETLRKMFSWNRGAIAAANKMIQVYSVLACEITEVALVDKTMSVGVVVSEATVVDTLTVSYVVFNQMEFPMRNNLIYQAFSLGGANATYGFAPLQNTDMTFIGLRGAQFKVANSFQFEFTVAKSKGSFYIYPTQTLPQEYLLHVSFLQTQTKPAYHCQNCPQSIFRFQTYCLTTCPRGYVNTVTPSQSTCKYCNISQFLIPNPTNTECVCAKQYFYNQATRQCQACHYSCLSCVGNGGCEACDTTDLMTKRVLDKETKFCVCKEGFFDNGNLVCEKCDASCLECTGASVYQCRRCKTGRSFDSTNRCKCGPNFVDENGECVCKEPNMLMDNTCYSKTLVNSQCSKSNMIETELNGRKVCLCQPGYQLFNSECLSCPSTFTLNLTTGKCECPPTSYLNSDNLCISCQPMKYYDSKFEKCLCKKQYFEREDGTCIDCPDKSKYENGRCQCVFNYFLKGNVCVKCQKTEDDANCLRVGQGEL